MQIPCHNFAKSIFLLHQKAICSKVTINYATAARTNYYNDAKPIKDVP